jgi:hypothetical protein
VGRRGERWEGEEEEGSMKLLPTSYGRRRRVFFRDLVFQRVFFSRYLTEILEMIFKHTNEYPLK